MIQATGFQESSLNIQENQIKSLSNINFKDKNQEELMEAAKQFESVFINQIFKALDATIEKDGMFSGGKGEKMFKGMFYQEIAKNIASDPTTSFGFAKQIYEQMKHSV